MTKKTQLTTKHGRAIRKAYIKANNIIDRAIDETVNEVVACIVRLRNDAKDPNNEFHRLDYLQGLRDALEAMKRYGLINDYDLRGI